MWLPICVCFLFLCLLVYVFVVVVDRLFVRVVAFCFFFGGGGGSVCFYCYVLVGSSSCVVGDFCSVFVVVVCVHGLLLLLLVVLHCCCLLVVIDMSPFEAEVAVWRRTSWISCKKWGWGCNVMQRAQALLPSNSPQKAVIITASRFSRTYL